MTTNLYQVLNFHVEQDGSLLWLKDESGTILCEVFTACEGETNEEMESAGYTPLDLQLGYWISEFDSKEVFGNYYF
jgi:hypothetical protein